MDWDNLRYFLEVARCQRISVAAQRLGVQHSTVARRIQALEQELGLRLFHKSTVSGYSLTSEGQNLQQRMEPVESRLLAAREAITGKARPLTGKLRLGCTEAFGSYVLTPLLSIFQTQYPELTLELLPVPRPISLSRRDADLAIALERPQRGPYWCTRLADYSLRLYAHQDYLNSHPPIESVQDLSQHRFIAYVDDLVFSDSLRYLEEIVRSAAVRFRSTSVIAQYQATLQGQGIAVLPCFLAKTDPRLRCVLPDQVELRRRFWMFCHEEQRQNPSLTRLWHFLKQSVQERQDLLDGA